MVRVLIDFERRIKARGDAAPHQKPAGRHAGPSCHTDDYPAAEPPSASPDGILTSNDNLRGDFVLRIMSVLALCLTFGLALGVQSISAQSTNASLAGRITDPSQARIAGASVAAINASTSSRYEAPSDASGEYVLANLPPGRLSDRN